MQTTYTFTKILLTKGNAVSAHNAILFSLKKKESLLFVAPWIDQREHYAELNKLDIKRITFI